MGFLSTTDLAERVACKAFVAARRVCSHDGQCFRRNPQHYADFAHPVEQGKPACPATLQCEPCRSQDVDHLRLYYHGPTARVLDRVARGCSPYPVPAAKRAKTVTTTTTTAAAAASVTTTTTTTTTAASVQVPKRPVVGGALRNAFVVPPFSVLDAKQGAWQTRKREWNALGLDSGAGRGDKLLDMGPLMDNMPKTSIFDPVLVECALRWYGPTPISGGPPVICIDPFAGGSVRGVVASMLGFAYFGIDPSATQVCENEKQATTICTGTVEHMPKWVVGDGMDIKQHFADFLNSSGLPADTRADVMLTCPPYFDLEKYGGDPATDLSMMSYSSFKTNYALILEHSTSLLKEHHVSVVVIGNVRDSTGAMRDLHGLTKTALETAGNVLYCDAVLETALASAPMRAGRQMQAASKLCSVHQNVVVTCRGAPLTSKLCKLYRISPSD